VVLQVDGTPGERPNGTAGVGVVVRSMDGRVVRWYTAQAPAHTCNEAEYQALIVGLQFVLSHFPNTQVVCLTDSRLVVDQMTGRVAVRSGPLLPLQREATKLSRQCRSIAFIAIPREINRLADALAWEALSGRARIERVGKLAVKRSDQ